MVTKGTYQYRYNGIVLHTQMPFVSNKISFERALVYIEEVSNWHHNGKRFLGVKETGHSNTIP